ncbi:helix-turn-helix domain-containing protein [Nonomuraea sp. NPDC050556]|uniref:helix-turn-helix domain-containing protein n=1 Tax=Nonomuraea sp. NPDC050556 TaxID=3364369 RepID=UPI0037927004
MAEVSPTLRRRRLAAELRRLREAADLNGAQVAKKLGWSTSKISRIETGQVVPQRKDVQDLLKCYGTPKVRAALLMGLAADAERKGWWEAYASDLHDVLSTYIGLESEAAEILGWQTSVVPGLLQTREYALAVNGLDLILGSTSPARVERTVEIRLRRQARLSAPTPLVLSMIIDEAVLLRRYGDEDVMRGQLLHLLKAAELPNVTLRVLRLADRHPAAWTDSLLLRFPEVEGLGQLSGDVLYSQSFNTQAIEEDEQITYNFSVVFDHLSDAALDVDDSRDLISALAAV